MFELNYIPDAIKYIEGKKATNVIFILPAFKISSVRITDLDKLYLVKFGNGGSVLGLSLFLLPPQLPQK